MTEPRERKQGDAHSERCGINGNGPGRRDEGHRGATHHATQRHAERGSDGNEPVGILQPLRGHRLRHDARQRGPEECLGRAVHEHDPHDRRHASHSKHEDDGEYGLAHAAYDVAANHHQAPGQAVRPHPTHQQEQHQWHRTSGQHKADIGGPATQFDDGEGHRHRRHDIADGGDELR